jgi:hypothetical protein
VVKNRGETQVDLDKVSTQCGELLSADVVIHVDGSLLIQIFVDVVFGDVDDSEVLEQFSPSELVPPELSLHGVDALAVAAFDLGDLGLQVGDALFDVP